MSCALRRNPSTLTGFVRIPFQLRPPLRPQHEKQFALSSHKSFSSRTLGALPRTSTQSSTLLRLQSRHAHYQVPPRFPPPRPRPPTTAPPSKFKLNLSPTQYIRELRKTFWIHPFQVSLGLAIIVVALTTFGIVLCYQYIKIEPEISKYPPKVAKDVRKALFYSTYDPQPQRALQHYKDALVVIRESDMDQFSPEVLYLKSNLAVWLASVNHHKLAIDVLEQVLSDCERWLKEIGNQPGKEAQRNNVLSATVRMSVKAAEFYGDDHVLQADKAEEKLAYAVETALKEQKRREEQGVKKGEGEWMSNDELGATFEELAEFYMNKQKFDLAAPLFLLAMTKADPKTCHMATLMNNVCGCLSKQKVPNIPGEAAISRATLISNARSWAQMAKDLASKIKPPERNEECDHTCVTSTYNLGELASMQGKFDEAWKFQKEAKSLAEAIEFKEGVVMAESALKRLREAKNKASEKKKVSGK